MKKVMVVDDVVITRGFYKELLSQQESAEDSSAEESIAGH